MIKKLAKISAWVLAGIVLLFVVFLLLVWKTNVVQNNAETLLNRALGNQGKIHYTSLRGSLFNTLQITDLDFELYGKARVRANQVELQYDLWPLLSDNIHISKVFINQLDIELQEATKPPSAQSGSAARHPKPNIDSLLQVFRHAHPIDSLLDALPNIEIGNVELFAGQVHIPSAKMHVSDLYVNLHQLSVGRDHYRIKLDKLSGRWVERDFNLNTISFELKGDRNHLSLNQFTLNTEHSRVQLSAFYDLSDTLDLNLNLYEANINLNDLYKLTANKELKSGYVQGTFSLSGAPRHFGVEASLNGEWKHHRLDTLQLAASYNKGDIFIDSLNVQSGQARFDLSGAAYQFAGGDGLLRFAHVNLNQFDSTQIETELNGFLRFNVSNLVLKRATGVGELRMQASKLDRLPIDSLRFKLKAHKGNFTIIEPSYLQVADSCRFTLDGTVSRHWVADLGLSTFDNQLGRIAQVFSADSLQSVFDGQFRLSGKLKDPTISGDLEMPHLRYQDVSFDSVGLQLYTRNIFSERDGELQFAIGQGRLGGIPLKNINLQADIHRNRIYFKRAELHSAHNYLKAELSLKYDAYGSELRIPQLDMMYEGYLLRNEDTLLLTMDSTEINVENLRLQGAAGSAIEAGGFWDIKEQDLQAFLILDKVKLKPFEIFWKNQFTLSGMVNGNVEILHPLHGPELNAELSADSIVLNSVRLGNITVDFAYANSAVQIKKMDVKNGDTFIKALGDFNLPSLKTDSNDLLNENIATSFYLSWKNFHIDHYLSLLHLEDEIKGVSSGEFRLSGTTGHPRIALSASLDQFNYDAFNLDSTRLYAQYNDGYMLLDSLYGVLNQTSFDVRGDLKYQLNLLHPDTLFTNKPMHLALRSSDNEISFIGLLNEQVEALRGAYDLKLEFAGTPNVPALTNGFIKMKNGEIILSRVRDPLKNVEIDADIEQSVFYLNSFAARSEREKDILEQSMQWLKALIPWSDQNWREGFLEVDGTVATANLMRPRFDLNIGMDAFYVDYFVENAAVVLTSDNLKVQGQDTLRITGDIQIPRGEFEVDLSKMAKNAYLSSTAVTQEPPFTAVNLGIDIPGNFVVSSSPLDLANNFKITLLGNLHIILEPPSDAVQIAGHMETVSGKYASWNQNFDIQNGTVDFKNPKEINPDINLLAVKKIGNRMFEVSVTGPLDDMDQNIRVTENDQELDMSYLDKIALLTLGADLGQITTQTDSTLRNVGEQVATTSVLTAVERGAEKYVGLDKVEINSSQSILDLERMRLNNGLQDASVSFGKYLTSDLYVEYKTQFGGDFPTPKLSWDAGNRIGLQYRINRYWSLDSFYEKTQRGNNIIQLGIKWELTF